MKPQHCNHRTGITIIELLISISIVSMLMAALGSMSLAVQRSSEYSRGYGEAAQHARIVKLRINTIASAATANVDFPGMWTVATPVTSFTFPDALVVWRPADGAKAIDPTGSPRINELVVFCPNPDSPNELVELTDPANVGLAPAIADTASWLSTLTAMRLSNSKEVTVLTDLLRVAVVPEAGVGAAEGTRGCIRFVARLAPKSSNWNNYQNDVIPWEDVSWSQTIYGPNMGLRQSWVRYELQLTPGRNFTANSAEAMPAAPFFGSVAIYYPLQP